MSNDAVNGYANHNTSEPHAGDERDDNDGEGERAAVPLTTDPPRRPRARVVAPPDGSSPSPFGAVPEGVTMWAARRKTMAGAWDQMTRSEPGGVQAERDWPLHMLTLETLQAWWGAGLYEIQWIQPAARGGRKVLLGGRKVEILAPQAVQHVAYQHPAPAAPDPFDGHLRFYEMIERISSAKMGQILEIARGVAAPQAGGLSFADLRELMREEREHQARQLQAHVAPLQAQIATLTAALNAEDEEDEDETPGAGAVVAKAAGSKLFAGKAWWQQAGQYLTENPEIAAKVAPVVLGAVNNVTSAVASALATPKAPPPRPAARLVAVPNPPPAAAPEPPPIRFHVEGVTNARKSAPPPAEEGAPEA